MGVACSGVWLDGWDEPVLSAVALFCPALYVVAAGTVLLRYPAPRLPSARERAFVVVLFGWLLAIYLGTALTPGMESPGDLGQRPYRPPPLLPPDAAVFIRTADWLGALLLGTAFVLLLVRRARRARGLDRSELVPVLIGAVATGVSMLSYRVGKVLAESDESVTALRLVHAIVLLAVPVAFAGAALRRRLERGAVADVVAGLSGAAPSRRSVTGSGGRCATPRWRSCTGCPRTPPTSTRRGVGSIHPASTTPAAWSCRSWPATAAAWRWCWPIRRCGGTAGWWRRR